jgi:hypothetical protein
MSKNTIGSPRATGDAIQTIIERDFKNILGKLIKDYSTDFARRSMADLSFTDTSDNYYIVDVKTHRAGTRFNMPNLTSVARLSELYKNDKNFFCILMVKYLTDNIDIIVKDVYFVPIEFLDWNCLRLGALGWGQIQIANSNKINFNFNNTRKKWMLELCNKIDTFYPKEILKIKKRIDHFNAIKEFWQNKNL